MQLVWLRNDLRIDDNTALSAAAGKGPTIAVWIASPEQWQRHDEAACKVDFWLRSLREVRAALDKLNIPLLIRKTETWADAPKTLVHLCQQHNVESVHWNEEYGIHEQQRDDAVIQALEKAGVSQQAHLDQLLFRPGTLLTKAGHYFQVFGQFRKLALNHLHRDLPSLAPKVKKQAATKIKSDAIPRGFDGFDAPDKAVRDLWPAGEDEAQRRLKRFVDEAIEDYHVQRDLPAKPGTSQLSAYLAAGAISPRQCLHAAMSGNQGEFDSGGKGPRTWIEELIWREFYKHILVGFPQVSRHKPFREHYEAIPWRNAPSELRAWEEGRTGFPLIDAAMRQLRETGWMHNRLRMVTAMFLSKNLLIDWRKGERFFMQHLMDGDLASNNGGWQWSASTGTDSVPYFRIFNPVTQSQRFDPDGRFIRQWVPELKDLDDKAIHMPRKDSDVIKGKQYPKPMVDLKESRERALAAFKNLKG